MSTVLLIDCVRPTACCLLVDRNSAAVVDRAQMAKAVDDARGRTVLAAADSLLRRNGLDPRSLAAVAAAVGPGPTTGIRVSIATAQGLALAGGLRMIAVPAWFGYADVSMVGVQQEVVLSLGDGLAARADVVVDAGGWRVHGVTLVRRSIPASDPDDSSVAAAIAAADLVDVTELSPIYLRAPDIRPQHDGWGRALGHSA